MLLTNGQTLPIAPQALSELEPQITESYYYPDRMGLQLEREYAFYGAIYRKQPWIRTVIDKRAMAVARLPVNVWSVNGDSRSIDSTSGYAKLMADPCPFLSPYSFWLWVQSTIDIYGETYLAIVKDDYDKPIGLFPMHPSRIAIKRDPDNGRYTYIFSSGMGVLGQLIAFDQDEVVPFRLFNPEHLERGLSRMESLKSTIFADDSSRNATDSMWKNAGRPNILLESEKPLSDMAKARLVKAFNMQHAGSSNAGKTLLLEDGVTASSFQLTAVEMQFIEARKMSREEVCAVYDINPTNVGILDHATFSNITEALRGFYRDTMAPPIEFIESVIDKHIGSCWTTKNEMKFAVEEVIRGDYEKRAESVQHLVTSGSMTPNEGRQLMGLSRKEDPKADELYANSALQPLGQPSEQIKLAGEVDGQTPDGVAVTAPATTPVASLDGSKPTSIPKPAPKPVAVPAPAQPSQTGPSAKPKHLRAIKGELGRGRTEDEIKSFAIQLAEKYPDELADILRAVQMAIAEQKGK